MGERNFKVGARAQKIGRKRPKKRDSGNRVKNPPQRGKSSGREAQENGEKVPKPGEKQITKEERSQQQRGKNSRMSITSPEKREKTLNWGKLPQNPPRFCLSSNPVMWKIDISPGLPRPMADVILKLPQIRKTRIFVSPENLLSPLK